MKVLLFLFLMLTLSVSCHSTGNQSTCEEWERFGELFTYQAYACFDFPSRPDDSYNYPLRPGMTEWGTLLTTEDKIAACQIPLEIVEKMSTPALIQAIWEYPLLSIRGSCKYNVEFATLQSLNNNTYTELLIRKDTGLELFKRLVSMDVLAHPYRECWESVMVEAWLAQNTFITQLDDGQKRKVVETCLKNDALRRKTHVCNYNIDWYLYAAYLLMARSMAAANYAPFMAAVSNSEGFQWFLDGHTPSFDDSRTLPYDYTPGLMERYGPADILQQIITYGEQFITEK